MFRVIALPADEGDALLVTWGTADDLKHMLIDTGPRGSQQQLFDALKFFGITRVEVLVITHIDDDHIGGIVELVKNNQFKLEVGDVWFNGKDHLTMPPEVGDLGRQQGDRLSEAIVSKRWSWNGSFQKRPICLEDGTKELPSFHLHGMKVTLLGPPRQALIDLDVKWPAAERELDMVFGELEFEPEAARKCLDPAIRPDVEDLAKPATVRDGSEQNGSSIAFLLEYDNKRAVFTGDAFNEHMISGLKKMPGGSPVEVDLYKVGHHGSRNNNSSDLFDLVRAKVYLFPTDGIKHPHPDRETVARILKSSARNPNLVFSYRSNCTTVWRDDDLQAKYGYTVEYPKKNANYVVVTLSD